MTSTKISKEDLMKKAPIFNEYSVLLILIATAIVTRFYHLGAWNFWYDEICTFYDSLNLHSINLWGKPVYYALCKLSFKMFGANEWSARFFSAVAGILAIPLFYLILKKITNVNTALLTLAFILFSPWHLFQSQSARFYTTVFLLGGLSAFWFYFGIQAKRYGVVIMSLFTALLGVLTHTTVIFIFPGFLLFVIFYYFLNRVSDIKFVTVRNILVTLFVVIFAGCFLIPLAIRTGQQWLGLGRDWGYSFPHLIMAIVSNVSIPITIIAFTTLLVLIYEQQMIGYFLLCYISVPFVFIAIIGQFANVRQDYIFFTIPGYFLLAAIGCSRIYDILKEKQSILAKGFICILLAVNIPSIISHYSDGNRHPLRKASEYIVNKMEPSDIVLCKSAGLINHYFNIDSKPLSIENLNLYKKQRRRIWILISYNRGGMSDVDDEIKDWIYENCRMVKELIPKRIDYIDNSVRIFKCSSFPKLK